MNENLVPGVLKAFELFKMKPTPNDQYGEVGRLALVNQLLQPMHVNSPIEVVMMGYPMKSPNNRDKVLGTLPDLAEEVSFQNFAKFSEEIKKVYSPGVKISIVSDGYVFNDILKVSDGVVQEYNEMSYDMRGQAPIEWYTLKDFYKESNLSSMRDKVTSQFGITEEVLQQRILMDPDVNYLYRGMIKFLSLDLAINNYPSNSQLHKQAKLIAKEMMFRNESYSALVRSEFKHHIRLSMHPSVNNGTKFSFRLIPGEKAWTSPWHCALLVDGTGEFETIHRMDAEKAGYTLEYKDGRPYYFEA